MEKAIPQFDCKERVALDFMLIIYDREHADNEKLVAAWL
jgi:hypothetical protein